MGHQRRVRGTLARPASAWFYTDQLGRDDWSRKVDVIVSR
jgi:hypothetical protein